MATHQSKAQKETIDRVMHEFKHGELESSSGQKVRNPKQAIAIGLSEAGASKYESKEQNRKNLNRTKARERRGLKSSENARDVTETSYGALFEQRRKRLQPFYAARQIMVITTADRPAQEEERVR